MSAPVLLLLVYTINKLGVFFPLVMSRLRRMRSARAAWVLDRTYAELDPLAFVCDVMLFE